MRDYTIIIPSCTESNLRTCLEALKSHQPNHRDKILVYDNDRTGGVEKACFDYNVSRVYSSTPFVFSRAINDCMSLCPDNDVIVMNDDAVLKTYAGFEELHRAAYENLDYGIISSAVDGVVGNHEQRPHGKYPIHKIRLATYHTIVFVCVHIPRDIINTLGPLDERLIHYGFDDDLYCLQTISIGKKLGTYDGCVVEHGKLPSTYRKPGAMPNLELNRRIFESIIREKKLEPWWPEPFVYPPEPLPELDKHESD